MDLEYFSVGLENKERTKLMTAIYRTMAASRKETQLLLTLMAAIAQWLFRKRNTAKRRGSRSGILSMAKKTTPGTVMKRISSQLIFFNRKLFFSKNKKYVFICLL
ncbi:hypothetical protein AMECASPLE_004065 [Ameca splendens]|uniref:Uncharacterized protein n=1 Tax=Ameca splendens TaxID=208324 RepID=A0ABV1A5V2_9TELE